MKKSDKDLNVPSDKRTFKKRYILRVYEEQEAQQEIKQYEDPCHDQNIETEFVKTVVKPTL